MPTGPGGPIKRKPLTNYH